MPDRLKDESKVETLTRMNFKSNKHQHRSFWWRVCCGIAIALSAITFTPLVIGDHASRIFHLPYLLAVGLILAIAFIAITIAGTFFYPKSLDRGDKK